MSRSTYVILAWGTLQIDIGFLVSRGGMWVVWDIGMTMNTKPPFISLKILTLPCIYVL